jgi:hypothetical protein
MEIPVDTLKAVGVNELFGVVTVDVYFTTDLTTSGSFGTHRGCLGFFGQLFLLERTPQQCQPPRTGWWMSTQPIEFLTKTERVSGPSFTSGKDFFKFFF